MSDEVRDLPPFACWACGMTVPLGSVRSQETKDGLFQALDVQKFRPSPDQSHPNQVWCGACHEEYAAIKECVQITPSEFQEARQDSQRVSVQPHFRIHNLVCDECEGQAVFEVAGTRRWTLTCTYPPCANRKEFNFDARGRRI